MARIASTYYLLGNKKESLKDLCMKIVTGTMKNYFKDWNKTLGIF